MSWYAKDDLGISSYFGFKAVCCIGPLAGWPIKIGSATDARRNIDFVQKDCWLKLIVHDLVWVPDLLANRVIKSFKDVAKRHKVKALLGAYYDVNYADAARLLVEAADVAKGVWLSHERLKERIAADSSLSLEKIMARAGRLEPADQFDEDYHNDMVERMRQELSSA